MMARPRSKSIGSVAPVHNKVDKNSTGYWPQKVGRSTASKNTMLGSTDDDNDSHGGQDNDHDEDD